MKKIMLIGRTGSGKTTLAQLLREENIEYKKTQDVQFIKNIIDTPGEYIEIKGYYKALIVSAVECDIVGFIQSAEDNESIFPPFFSEILNKPAIGIITKKDLVKNTKNAEKILKEIGMKRIVSISSKTGDGLDEMKKILRGGLDENFYCR